MRFRKFQTGCVAFVAGCVLLSASAARAQNRNGASARLRIRVVVVPTVRVPLPPIEKRQEPAPKTFIDFDFTSRPKSAAHSASEILIQNPATHQAQRAELQTLTIVAE